MERIRRIKSDILEINESPDLQGQIGPIEPLDDDLKTLKGFIRGPDDSPYSGGLFEVKIVIPSNYPFKPPNVYFTTPIWHPNITSDGGYICLDILKTKWSAAMNLKSILLSLQLLLQDPNPLSPLNGACASQMRTDRNSYFRTAQGWVKKHAKSSNKGDNCASRPKPNSTPILDTSGGNWRFVPHGSGSRGAAGRGRGGLGNRDRRMVNRRGRGRGRRGTGSM